MAAGLGIGQKAIIENNYIVGYPNIAVPMGSVDALPVFLSFSGKVWNEPHLLEITYAYEQGTKIRKAQRYIATD